MKLEFYNYDKRPHDFRCLVPYLEEIEAAGFEIVTSDGDVQLVTRGTLMPGNMPLSQSIDNAMKILDKLENPLIYDSSDSTSVFFTWELRRHTPSRILIKNQITTLDNYNKTSPYGKWFWGRTGSIAYNAEMTEKEYIEDLFLSHTNIHAWMRMNFINPANYRKINVFARMGSLEGTNMSYGHDNRVYYNKHRKDFIEEATKAGIKIDTSKVPYQQYIQELANSRYCLSPFGMGELCLRDIEAIYCGSLPIKPNTQTITYPNYSKHLYHLNFAKLPSEEYRVGQLSVLQSLFKRYKLTNKITEQWKKIKDRVSV